MRGSMDRGKRLAARSIATLLGLTMLLAACGTVATTPTPPPSPSPTPTPDPHLAEPAKAADVYRELGKAGLRITANNAASGGTSGEPVRRVNATFEGWPLILSEFSSARALAERGTFIPDRAPTRDEAPFSVAGMNILLEYGPHAKNDNAAPDARFVAAAQRLVAALDPLIGPLSQSSVVPLTLPAAPSAVPSGAPASAPASAPAPSPSS